MTFEDILGAVARGWCDPKNQHKYMDVDLVIAIAKEVQDLYTSKQPVQNSHEFVHVEGKYAKPSRVYDITGAEPPPADSGFAKL
jgi:hypothetical protein